MIDTMYDDLKAFEDRYEGYSMGYIWQRWIRS